MATDGILGFGQSGTSVISQLASAKKARKIFAHCLDSQHGGIFAIGNVVQPKVQTTPIVPNQSHYNINLENIQVGKDKITGDDLGSQAVIDSGTTLAYLPQKLYDPLISKEYELCIGWQNSAVLSKEVNTLTILGGSSNIEIEDDQSGSSYQVASVKLSSSAETLFSGRAAVGVGLQRTIREIKRHDIRRHGRSLAGIDLPLGGDGRPTDSGLYYTKIGIGTPSNDYYVHVDTGSDIFWVNCIECKQCPKKSDLGIELRLYNPHTSSTGQTVGCDDQFCQTLAQGPVPNCSPGALCEYVMKYGDGSATGGYVVKDVINYDQVSGNLQTTKGNASVTFG
ncbi:hypothetical protein Sjap_009205 [Stephania japonica]|uniref:Peptidase A1 domain-containing protein n=1 Tax=Stephania japonica TaxID=461633 RepID=A0AAP0PF79_9MAGN